jgi:hypothetical protein
LNFKRISEIQHAHYTNTEFTYTASSGSTKWNKTDATVSGTNVSFRIPDGIKYFYITVTDSRSIRISTEVVAN